MLVCLGGLEPATYGLPGCLIDADSAFLSLFCNNYITNLLQSQFFGSPAQNRTEFIAFRGLPVLETGVLTNTLRGSIVL